MERNHKAIYTRFILPMLILAGAMICSAAQAAEVYRWVDENGDVHYTETLPPHLKGTKHDILNERGIVTDEDQSMAPPPAKTKVVKKSEPAELPRDASGMPRPKALYTESEMQQQMDNFLLLRYDSEQEIVDAMNVEIKQLNYDRRLIETSRRSTNDAYRGQIRIAAEKQRSGVAVEADAVQEIEGLRSRLAENQSSLNGLQERENQIRGEFQVQLDRYQYLIERSEEEAAEG